MLRGSMLIGWWRLIRYQRRNPSIDGDDHNNVDEARFSKQEKVHGYPNFVLPKETNSTKRKSYGIRLESEKPGMASPTESEYSRAPVSPISPIGTAWPMSPPPQTSTQRNSGHGAYPPLAERVPERQVPTDGFDSSSDDEEDRIEPLQVRKQDHNIV